MSKSLVSLAFLVVGVSTSAQDLRFSIDPAKTWTDGTMRIQFWSQGSFKGTFDPLKLPYGTQTKVGNDGWGLAENDTVACSPYLELGHAALVRTSGSFRLIVDRGTFSVQLADYATDRIPDRGGIQLSATVALNNVAFKTVKPTGAFADHLRPLSLGVATVDKFTITQKPGIRSGTLVPIGRDDYLVAVTFMATAQMSVKEFGQAFPFTFDVPASLVGRLHFGTTTATFGYPRGQGGENVTRDVSLKVAALPFFVLNSQRLPASLLLDATVGRVGLSVNGTRQMEAGAALP